MKLVKGFVAIAILAGFASCKDSDSNKTANGIHKISVQQEWFANANFCGELYAAANTDSVEGLDIQVKAGSENTDPVKLVIAGNSEFGVVGADKVLLANANGADLVIVGVCNQQSPTVFLSAKTSGINTPQDFRGRKIGVLTGTATEGVYRSLLSKAGLTSKDVKEIEASWDLNVFKIGKEFEVRPAFAYDEPVTLDLEKDTSKFEYNTIYPEQYGVRFIGPVYFTTRSFAEKNKDIVQHFINAVANGWIGVQQKPDAAIKLLQGFDKTINPERERRSLEKALPYYKGYNGRVLTADPSSWEPMVADLNAQEHGKTKVAINYRGVVDTTFTSAFHKSNNK